MQTKPYAIHLCLWRTISHISCYPLFIQYLLFHNIGLYNYERLLCCIRIKQWWTENERFYIHGSVHRDSILIRSNKMQQYSGIYLLQIYPTCFGCPSHPSSVHKTVIAASGTGHSIWATTFLRRGNATSEEGCCSDTMTCTRGCSYSFMYSWWWVRWTPETCRVILQ